MSFLGKLFGTDEAMQKTLDAGISAVDKSVFTAEEKAELKAKMIVLVGDYMKKTSGQDLARRLIALVLVFQYIVLINSAIVLTLMGSDESGQFVFNVMVDTMQTPLNIIVGFYFATQFIRGYRDKKNGV